MRRERQNSSFRTPVTVSNPTMKMMATSHARILSTGFSR
jgi:hypothetical protein